MSFNKLDRNVTKKTDNDEKKQQQPKLRYPVQVCVLTASEINNGRRADLRSWWNRFARRTSSLRRIAVRLKWFYQRRALFLQGGGGTKLIKQTLFKSPF